MDKVFLPFLVSSVDQNLLCSGSEAFSKMFIIVTEVRLKGEGDGSHGNLFTLSLYGSWSWEHLV